MILDPGQCKMCEVSFLKNFSTKTDDVFLSPPIPLGHTHHFPENYELSNAVLTMGKRCKQRWINCLCHRGVQLSFTMSRLSTDNQQTVPSQTEEVHVVFQRRKPRFLILSPQWTRNYIEKWLSYEYIRCMLFSLPAWFSILPYEAKMLISLQAGLYSLLALQRSIHHFNFREYWDTIYDNPYPITIVGFIAIYIVPSSTTKYLMVF